MRIEHLAFCLLLTFGVLNGDDILEKLTSNTKKQNEELQEEINHFINDRLIPLLRKTGKGKKFDLTRIRICQCAAQSGCNVRTAGFLPSVEGLLPNETERFKLSCFTDGKCYQQAWRNLMENQFGCVDLSSLKLKIHDHMFPTCKKEKEHYSICCDNENYCSSKSSFSYSSEQLPEPSKTTVVVVVIFVIFVIVLIGLFVYFNRLHKLKSICWRTRCKDNEDGADENRRARHRVQNNNLSDTSATFQTMSTSAGEEHSPGLETQAINFVLSLEETSGSGAGPSMLHQSTIGNQVTIHGRIGSGGFGSVSRGTYRGEQVAVKIFKCCDEASYNKEVGIYETNMLRHANVLRYIGSDRVEVRQKTEMWLVTEYHPSGSLHDFLEKNIINLDYWYRLMRSAANGLDFLHCAVPGITLSSNKPSIAHRDIKSRNIMVKNDMTCAIGDLGLSLSSNSTKIDVDATSLRCGTVRYLAPEILDGTIQGENFESYLMADVYAFALVMWEALCRTEEDEVQARDAETVIPYFEWSQRDPNDEQMRDIVCVRSLRPTEASGWSTNPEFKPVLELIMTCWHANPTARFSSLQTRVRLDNLIRKRRENAANLIAASTLVTSSQESPRRTGKPQKEIEMTAWGVKVHDQETIETRNGSYRGKDEMKDPLLGC